MAINLEAMRAKLEKSKNGGKKKSDGTKWRPQQGDQTIRILPTADGDPFKEYFSTMLVKIRNFSIPKRIMAVTVQSVTSLPSCGVKALTTMMM